MAIPPFARAGALAAVAVVVALLALAFAGPAHAERPGWYSPPSIVSGSPAVGSTLSGSDGGLHCLPVCQPDGPDPARAGIFLEWVSCPGPTSAGADRPTGGMADDPRPCPGGVSRTTPTVGATQYTIRPEDAGRYIQLHVIGTNFDCGEINYSTGQTDCRYSSGHGYSATVGPVPGSAATPPPPPASSSGPPNMTAYPETTGLAKEGQTLTAANGAWSASPTKYTYQWKRCAPEFEPCTTIAGATSKTYVLTTDDVGKRVQVLVTATNAKGSNSAASFPSEIVETTAVAPANTAPPTVSGTVEDRQTLTASPGTWTGTDTIEYAYQWLRCSTKAGGCTPIEGATAQTYAVTRDDLAARLVVSVTATNRAGSATVSSSLTTHVVAAKPRPGADRLEVTELTAGNGLVVADARVTTKSVKAKGAVVVSVRVADRRGFLIEGARVTVTGPRGAVVRGVTVTTREDGTATVRLRAGAKLPKGKLVLTVTISTPGEVELTATKRVAVKVQTTK